MILNPRTGDRSYSSAMIIHAADFLPVIYALVVDGVKARYSKTLLLNMEHF